MVALCSENVEVDWQALSDNHSRALMSIDWPAQSGPRALPLLSMGASFMPPLLPPSGRLAMGPQEPPSASRSADDSPAMADFVSDLG
jgi:hypothetical protein